MPRKAAAVRRQIAVDPKFKSELASKFVNSLMHDGEKAIAQKIFYKSLELVVQHFENHGSVDAFEGAEGPHKGKKNKAGLILLKKALDNVSPSVEVRSRRVGGATYQVPVEVPTHRRLALAIRWLIEGARKRKEKGMISRLSRELIEAIEGKGNAMEKLLGVLKAAKANQAFAHYRWN